VYNFSRDAPVVTADEARGSSPACRKDDSDEEEGEESGLEGEDSGVERPLRARSTPRCNVGSEQLLEAADPPQISSECCSLPTDW